MAPNSRLWKREAEVESDAAKLADVASTLATKIFGHKQKHHTTTTESELDAGKFGDVGVNLLHIYQKPFIALLYNDNVSKLISIKSFLMKRSCI